MELVTTEYVIWSQYNCIYISTSSSKYDIVWWYWTKATLEIDLEVKATWKTQSVLMKTRIERYDSKV